MNNNFLEPSELIALLKAARKRSVRDWGILLLGYRHALRAVELSELKLADVNLKDGTIRVHRAKGSLETLQPLERLAGHPEMDEFKAIKQWLAKRDDNSDFFFVSQKGGQMNTATIWRIFNAAAEEAGIKERSVHSLKHTRVSLLLKGGAPISEVRQAAGHRSLSSTLRYVHATDESAARAARRAEANVF